MSSLASTAPEQRILVTGANTGIGLALCKQLCADETRNCFVYLGSRSADKGAAAVREIQHEIPKARLELLVIDVGDDASVSAAAHSIQDAGELYAMVNNAGTGLSHGSSTDTIVNVNIRGPKRVVDAFLPLLSPHGGRIVNVGSGSGPMFVRQQTPELRRRLCGALAWDDVEATLTERLKGDDGSGGYGLTKALLACYTLQLAQDYPAILSLCLTPGFIDTGITAGYGAAKKPSEGTVSLRHCLFGDIAPATSNGWFYGSDAKRSPLHYMRNPGEPEYDGADMPSTTS